jgi:hypothetical protein
MERKKEIREETPSPDLPSVVGIIGELRLHCNEIRTRSTSVLDPNPLPE